MLQTGIMLEKKEEIDEEFKKRLIGLEILIKLLVREMKKTE
jgi:hypothetical protein